MKKNMYTLKHSAFIALFLTILTIAIFAYFYEAIDLGVFLSKHETTQGTVVDHNIREAHTAGGTKVLPGIVFSTSMKVPTQYYITINTQDEDLNYNVKYLVSKSDYDEIEVGDFVEVEESWKPAGYNIIK